MLVLCYSSHSKLLLISCPLSFKDDLQSLSYFFLSFLIGKKDEHINKSAEIKNRM